MGILNATPDSFADGGRYNTPERFYRQAEYLLKSGVRVLDIGAESTAPMGQSIEGAEERERLVPFFAPLDDLMGQYAFALSLDTYRLKTVRFFFRKILKKHSCVFFWNDVSGILDSAPRSFLSEFPNSYYICTHSRVPNREASSKHRDYIKTSLNGVEMVTRFWLKAKAFFRKYNLNSRIWWDPGLGFSKTLKQNEELMEFFACGEGLDKLALNSFVLGASRKSFLRFRCQEKNPSLKGEELLLSTEKLHAYWIKSWRRALGNRRILVRLHDPKIGGEWWDSA